MNEPQQSPPSPFRDGEVLAIFRLESSLEPAEPFAFDPGSLATQFRDAGIYADAEPLPREAGVLFANDGSVYITQVVRLADQSHDAVLRTVRAWNDARRRTRVVVDNAQLLDISPVFHTGASQSWGDGGGPGGQPQPGIDRYFRPRKTDVYNGDPDFIQAEYRRVTGDPARDELAGAGVRVAILDTWPMGPNPENNNQVDHVGKILTFVTGKGITAPVHPLLFAASQDALVQAFHDKSPNPAIPYKLVNWVRFVYEPGSDKSDHGLFIAGIIRDIAPGASIGVWRVLNDTGGGDIGDMFAALGEITREIWLARRANRYLRYVVNLSFGFLAPIRMIPILIANPNLTEPQQIQALASTANPNSPEDDLRALAGARLVRTEVTPGGALRIAEWLRTRGPLARSLSAIVDRFKDLVQYPEILMIAAAGNDSDRPRDLLFPPRIPAALEGILGVSATKAASVFANFSNRDDLELPRDDGIAAFGGERVDNGAVYLTDVGLFGLAVRDDFPAYAAGGPVVPNTNGWAQWAGTSFATPVVAGFAAGIWAVNPYADGQSILRRLVSPNTGPRNEILLTQQ